jgi:S-formylglutathione hydrolase FrmB
MSAILTFLGGGAFRAIWGEVASYVTKRQDAKLEIERMRLQGELDAAQATRNLEAIKVQAELGVKTINVQADADVARSEADAFREAMARAATPTGIKWVDAWNSAIRPSFATIALSLWALSLYYNDWKLTDWDLSMIGAIAGFYFADRALRKLKK